MSSLGFVLLGALAVIVGALIPVQAATNAAMSRVIGLRRRGRMGDRGNQHRPRDDARRGERLVGQALLCWAAGSVDSARVAYSVSLLAPSAYQNLVRRG